MKPEKESHRLLIEHLPDAFACHRLVLDDQGNPADYIFLQVNSAFEQMTGLKRENIIDRKVTEVIPSIEKDQFDWIGNYGRVALSSDPIRFESYSEPLGRWYDVSAYSDKQGFFTVLFRDISDNKKTEQDLRESESKLRSVLNSSIAAIWSVSWPDLAVLYLSPAAEQLYGHSVQEFINNPELWRKVVHPEDQSLNEEVLDVLSKEGRAERECRILRPEGETVWICDRSRLIYDDVHNMPVRIEGITFDITSRKLAEKKLAETESRFQRMLEVIPDMVSVQDPDMNIVYSNWKGFAAVPPEKRVLDTKCYKTYRDYDQICPDCQAVGVLKSKEAFQAEVELSKGYWIDLRVIPLPDSSGEIEFFVEWVRDISVLKVMEEELKSVNVELEQKVKERTAQLVAINRELDAFSYSVSHDLRGPLNRIEGFSRALLEDYSDQLDRQGRDYLQRIGNSSQHMAELIEDLLKLSRVSRLEINREPVELSVLVNVCLKELQAKEPQRKLESVVTSGLVVEGDTALLRIAVDNLVGNAWKFSRKEEKTHIEFGITEQAGRRIFYICDNGSGFDMNNSGKLFTAFQRLHSEQDFPGTGIGLSIVSRIITRHGGEIWAEGAPGSGACFYFTLP